MKQRLNSTVERTVADFEGGTLDTDAFTRSEGGSEFSVQSSVVNNGNYALRMRTKPDGDFADITSKSGLPAYPQRGDTYRSFVYATDADQRITVILLSELGETKFIVDYNSDLLLFTDDLGNVGNVDLGLSNYVNEWIEVVAEIDNNGFIVVTLFDSNNNKIGSINTDITSKITGIKVKTLNRAGDTQLTAYIDDLTLERRETEARTNTQKGTTQLGNEVVPSGGIHTGPQEVSPDHPNYPLVNLPVTDGLSAGDPVSYHLGVKEEPLLRIEAEADGNGGIQNPNVSFENTQIADPANNTTADSMTADPESGSEDGYVEVDIGGTTYQIPMYQA